VSDHASGDCSVRGFRRAERLRRSDTTR
jgi:hypothetical protein